MRIGLFLITILGTLLRLLNISPFKFYPDSYQNLLVAENIATYQSVFGFMGRDGMFYPDFLMWTRPFYPLLINIGSIFTLPADTSAQYVATLCSILAIPAAYIYGRNVFNSKTAGIISSLLLALSFNHIVWSGFIFTEAPAVLFSLLFLITLTRNFSAKSKLADTFDLLTGALFSIAVFTRYEYIILLLPVTVLLFLRNPDPGIKLANILLGFFLISSLFLSQLYPLADILSPAVEQLQSLFMMGLLLAMVVGGLGLFLYVKRKNIEEGFIQNIHYTTIGCVSAIATLITLQSIMPNFFLATELEAVRSFFIHDFALGILFLIGLPLLLKDKDYRHYGWFALLSIAVLWPIYYRINPGMQRYWTHLLPFILIPATYGLLKTWEWAKNFKYHYHALFILFLLIASQVYISFWGMKPWDQGTWFRPSYEEASAHHLSNLQPLTSNLLIIASYPEAYYFHTRIPTHSIADELPYIYIDDSQNEKNVLIIEDIGMRDLFPNFTTFLNQHLQNYKIDEYRAGESYRYATRVVPEDKPVIVYKIKLGKLKELIKK